MILRRSCSKAICLNSHTLAYQSKRLISSPAISQEPNAPLELDPSLKHLLEDTNMSLLKHKYTPKSSFDTSLIKELEILKFDESSTEHNTDYESEPVRTERKSPRARFGSNGIGSVTLPRELQNVIEGIIEDCDKPRLHEDAKRLFHKEGNNQMEYWDTSYDVEYRTRKQAATHANRDSTAFASIALPAHYSAIYAVLDNVKNRLGEEWEVRHVLEWGSGVGSGLWASMHAFQQSYQHGEAEDPLLSQSSVSSYYGFDKRNGLLSMARKLIEGVDLGQRVVQWGKGYDQISGKDDIEKSHSLALSAFHLSSLPNIASKKELVKEMWDSGAGVIILMDHDTPQGFANVVEAREYLLELGKQALEDPNDNTPVGCHVVAPCPHEGSCPLYDSSKLKCSFSQRLQRPAFLRRTKHARAGHEDIGYSYVVIRRGQRPSAHALQIKKENKDTAPARSGSVSGSVLNSSTQDIRLEAYDWPRLVFPPLKKSGHVIIDGCTSEGKIMRMTIPRSQGKQAYYDARKSSWGDIFPHKPKNPPQVRLQANGKKDETILPGSDIGKRRVNERAQGSTSYENISASLKELKKVKNKKQGRNKLM